MAAVPRAVLEERREDTTLPFKLRQRKTVRALKESGMSVRGGRGVHFWVTSSTSAVATPDQLTSAIPVRVHTTPPFSAGSHMVWSAEEQQFVVPIKNGDEEEKNCGLRFIAPVDSVHPWLRCINREVVAPLTEALLDLVTSFLRKVSASRDDWKHHGSVLFGAKPGLRREIQKRCRATVRNSSCPREQAYSVEWMRKVRSRSAEVDGKERCDDEQIDLTGETSAYDWVDLTRG